MEIKNVAIKGNEVFGDKIIKFLEEQGGINDTHWLGTDVTKCYYINSLGNISADKILNTPYTITTLEQAKKLVNSKPLPREILVSSNTDATWYRRTVVFFDKNNKPLCLMAGHEEAYEENRISYTFCVWNRWKELPNEEVIKQEKINSLLKEISDLTTEHVNQISKLQNQIAELKQSK